MDWKLVSRRIANQSERLFQSRLAAAVNTMTPPPSGAARNSAEHGARLAWLQSTRDRRVLDLTASKKKLSMAGMVSTQLERGAQPEQLAADLIACLDDVAFASHLSFAMIYHDKVWSDEMLKGFAALLREHGWTVQPPRKEKPGTARKRGKKKRPRALRVHQAVRRWTPRDYQEEEQRR